MSKTLLKNTKDWKDYKEYNLKEEGNWIQSESETDPLEYPCIVVETRWYEGCKNADDQFVRFVYMNDFKK